MGKASKGHRRRRRETDIDLSIAPHLFTREAVCMQICARVCGACVSALARGYYLCVCMCVCVCAFLVDMYMSAPIE